MYAERREQVLRAMGPGAMVVPAAATAIRNNDVEHDYRQDSDLYYLTGFEEPHAVLVLTNVHDEHRSVLFLQPRDPSVRFGMVHASVRSVRRKRWAWTRRTRSRS